MLVLHCVGSFKRTKMSLKYVLFLFMCLFIYFVECSAWDFFEFTVSFA